MPIEPGATYVFDLGYYDFGLVGELDALGCRIVTRFKTNTPLNSPRDLPLPPGSALLGDRIGFLPARQAMNRKNPMQDAVREIVVRTESRQDPAPPHQRSRRARPGDRRSLQAPLADRAVLPLMKQTLRITKFVGRSENAVRIQIAVALIAFLLLRVLQQITKDVHGFLELVQLVRANLMHRKDATRLRKPPPPPPPDSNQLRLCLNST